MAARINYEGFVIAGIGFILTRFTVTLAIYEDPVRFYLAGVLPLLLGLGLAAFGVALVVANVEYQLVRTTAIWCVIGTAAMLVLVVLTLLGSTTGGMPDLASVRSRTYLSNFLIGGSVGGTMTGLYAARTHRHRAAMEQQANRLAVLNRLLRHEVLNAVTIIRGYATLDGSTAVDPGDIIAERSDAIERTIEEVKFLAPGGTRAQTAQDTIDLGVSLERSIETIATEHPAARISLASIPDTIAVKANQQLERVFIHLLENAVVHASDDEPAVDVTVETTPSQVDISIHDAGPGLPERKQALLERGEIGTYDDPESGFGLNVVQLLVESYGGSIETTVGDEGSTITVSLQRAAPETQNEGPIPSDLTGVRAAVPGLLVTLGAALVAGIVYGIVAELMGGSIAAIGVFYGFANPVVGWITHEFHSVVFGFVFAGLVSIAPLRFRTHAVAQVAIAVGWALTLWLIAAGVIAPLWLRFQGLDAPVPNITFEFFVYHLAWGLTLGLVSAVGYARVTPWLADRLE